MEMKINCNTVGDLLDELARLAKNPEYQGVMDSPIGGPDGGAFDGFTITELKLEDGSVFLNLEFVEA